MNLETALKLLKPRLLKIPFSFPTFSQPPPVIRPLNHHQVYVPPGLHTPTLTALQSAFATVELLNKHTEVGLPLNQTIATIHSRTETLAQLALEAPPFIEPHLSQTKVEVHS